MILAYLSNFYPSLTETFIYKEVFELQRRGVPVKSYSLRKPSAQHMSQEALSLHRNTYYLLPVNLFDLVRYHVWFFIRHPLRYVSTLTKMLTGTHKHYRDRIRSLMHFGEGVMLAYRMLDDDITHIHAHFATQSASVARTIWLLAGIPYSFTGHAEDIWLDQLLLPEKLDESAFAVCCSNMGRRWLLKQAKKDVSEKVHLVYHGIDVQDFPLSDGEEREQDLILSVGRLHEQKGFPDLISACASLRDRGYEFRCLIVGEGEQRDELERFIDSHSLQGKVQLVGSVPQERIRQYYRRASIFVLPCTDTRDGNRDGIPNVLMEAMSMGLPVITTRNSGQPELIEHEVHGLLVDSNAPDQLTRAIIRLFGDKVLRERLRKAARKRIEVDFDRRNTILPLLNLFETFVGAAIQGQKPGARSKHGRSVWKR